MHLSESEWAALLIFMISAAKTGWDIWISKLVFERRSKGKEGTSLTQEVKAKRERDSISSMLAFAGIMILTVLIIGEGAMTKDITREEFDSLDERVERIEDLINPSGGGVHELKDLVRKLDKRISNLERTSASKKDVDDIKRITAKITNSLERMQITRTAR